MKKIFLAAALVLTAVCSWAYCKDVYAFEVVDGVPSNAPKRIRTSVAGQETEVEFSPAGRLVKFNGHDVNDENVKIERQNGRFTKVILEEGGQTITQVFTDYDEVEMLPRTQLVYVNGQPTMSLQAKKYDRGRYLVVDANVGGVKFTTKYKDYKFDNHGNWIYRTFKNPNGVKIEERRDIEYYYSGSAFKNLGDWKCLVNGRGYNVMFECTDHKNVRRLPQPYQRIWFESYGGVGGTFFPSSSSYFEVRDGKLVILEDGNVVETFTFVSPDNKGYIQIVDSKGRDLYLRP